MKSLTMTLAAALAAWAGAPAWPHPMMGSITWNRHVSRIVYAHCVSCHRDGGTAFSLLEYAEAREAAEAIKAAVLERTMPPWGAVKGFGDLRDEGALSAMEIDLVAEWVDRGAPRGNNRHALPEVPAPATSETDGVARGDAIVVSGETALAEPVTIAGLLPDRVAPEDSLQIVAVSPDGSVSPLVWLYRYARDFPHAFWFAKPLRLPSGTIVRGVPQDASVLLLRAGAETDGR